MNSLDVVVGMSVDSGKTEISLLLLLLLPRLLLSVVLGVDEVEPSVEPV